MAMPTNDDAARLLAQLDAEYQQTRVPPASPYLTVRNGHVVETQPGFLAQNPWLLPVVQTTLTAQSSRMQPSTRDRLGDEPTGGGTGAGDDVLPGTGGSGYDPTNPQDQGGGGGGLPSPFPHVPAVPPQGSVPASLVAGTTTPAVAKSASLLGPILQSVIPTVGGLFGAGIQSSGIKEAAEIQAAYLREALAYEKQRDSYLQNLESQRYGDLTGRLQPYIAIGQTAGDRMAALLGLNPSGHGYTPPQPTDQNAGLLPTTQPSGAPSLHTMPVGTAPSGPRPDVPQMAPQTAPAMVWMRAPTGETRQVPSSQVAQLRAAGAQLVNG